jgi:hypothetical protein
VKYADKLDTIPLAAWAGNTLANGIGGALRRGSQLWSILCVLDDDSSVIVVSGLPT